MKKKISINDLEFKKDNRNYARYYLYKRDSMIFPEDVSGIYQNENTACFSRLTSELCENDYDTMYLITIPEKQNNISSNCKKESDRWIELCRKNKFIMDGVKVDNSKHRYLIPLENPTNANQLYITLNCLRMFQENPNFIKTMLLLEDNFNLNFFIEWGISSKLTSSNSLHDIVNISRGLESNPLKSTIQIVYIYGMKRIFEESLVSDTPNIMDNERWKVTGEVFNRYSKLRNHTAKFEDMFESYTEDYINADYKDAIKIGNKYYS
mgnify:FL=1